MDPDRLHRAVSTDGTRIAGRVEGEGPPLVLVHGSLEDGDLGWQAMLPHLRDHFTCFLPSMRGRGRSGASDDLAPRRRVDDVAAFVASIGEPVRVFGESDGGTLALAAAAQQDGLVAVGVYEPVVLEAADPDVLEALEVTVSRVGEAVEDGRLADAARIFSELVANDDELSELASSGYFDAAACHMPVLLRELEEETQSTEPGSTDPSRLVEITAPTLVLHGQRSARRHFFADGARHVADHVATTQLRTVDGAGHFGVTFQPGPIAEELVRFLERVDRPT